MKMIKHMAYAALAAAVAVGITGCGSKVDYSQPKVAEGTIVAMVGRSANATSLKPICEKYGLASNDLSQLPKEVKDVIADSGLDKADVKWVAVTIGDISAALKDKGAPDAAVAIAATFNLDTAVAAVEKKLKEKKEEVTFKKTTIAGVPAYEIHSKDEKVVPCIASLDGQLFLGTASAASLEKQIGLYRDGKGSSKDFGAFALGANDIIRIKAVKVGDNVKKNLPDPEMLKAVNQIIPDGDKIVLGLGALDITLTASGDGKDIKLDMSVETAADADADKIAAIAKTGLMTFTAQMKEGAAKDADAKAAYDVLQGTKIEAKGKVITLSASTAADPAMKALADKAKAIK